MPLHHCVWGAFYVWLKKNIFKRNSKELSIDLLSEFEEHLLSRYFLTQDIIDLLNIDKEDVLLARKDLIIAAEKEFVESLNIEYIT